MKNNMKFNLTCNKAIAISSPIISICIILLVVRWIFPPQAPDPAALGAEAAARYVATSSFRRLPEAQKVAYVHKMMRTSGNPRQMMSTLNEKEREAIHKNMHRQMQQHMKERVKKFFSMSEAEQDAYLDKMIEEMKNRRLPGPPPGSAGKSSGNTQRSGPPGGGNSAQRRARMQQMLESTDSTTRARMHEMFKRLHERMKANR